jgi:flagellar biosynthesis/type III secretory pathway M-ring protein FliF/YscJ
MDALKAQFERIRQQLSALTSTQKMLVAALIAIMVLTMLYWGKYAQNAEMVSLLGDQTLDETDIGSIDKQLDLSGVQHSLVSGKIMVPADRHAELLANLMYARALPSDTHSAFETMSAKLNPWASNSEREASYTQATANDLSDVISRMPGVKEARVVLNAKNDVRVEGSVLPTATVFITTRGSIEDKMGLVRATADGVAGAVSGLHPSQISVIINRESLKVPDGDESNIAELSDKRKAREHELEQKIRTLLVIDGLQVAVNCDVEIGTKESSDLEHDKSKTFVEPLHTQTSDTETTTNNPTARDPGVGSNTGAGGAGANGAASVDAGSASGGSNPNTSSVQTESTDNTVILDEHRTSTRTPAGKDRVVSATVNVPLSYFPLAYKRLNPKAPDPDESTLAVARTAELSRIHDLLKNAIGLKTDGDISVEYYADPPVDTTSLAAAVAPMTAMTTVTGHAKEIGIGLLAIVSLLMMATLARKSSPAPALAGSFAGAGGESNIPVAAAARPGLNTLGSGEDLAGEVAMANSALDGVEMDDDAIRTQQVLDQVSNMVKENPDGAAALVKRWLGRP